MTSIRSKNRQSGGLCALRQPSPPCGAKPTHLFIIIIIIIGNKTIKTDKDTDTDTDGLVYPENFFLITLAYEPRGQ